MVHDSIRVPGPTEQCQRRAPRLALLLLCAPGLTACVAYESAPIELPRILSELQARSLDAAELKAEGPGGGASQQQLAAFAVIHNPSLAAYRARIGVSEALLVQAGMLSDPEFSWDGMDVFASQAVTGSSSHLDSLSGFGLSIPIPRPGELSSQKGAARWRLEAARRRAIRVEWSLARDVHLACESVLEAERLIEQNVELLQLAEITQQYFERARSAGAATAIQANLAFGDAMLFEAKSMRLGAQLREARQELNSLLGLPPRSVVPILPTTATELAPTAETAAQLDALVEASLELRPDLAVLLASYRSAEEELRLEIAHQYPQLALGTGIWLVPALFTRFNRGAIETALARRSALQEEVEAMVHEVRRDIHDAHESLLETERELRFLESRLLPNAEESLRLARQAFDAGEVTLIEILILQHALLDARTRTTTVRSETRRKHWALLAASGQLLAPGRDELPQSDEVSAGKDKKGPAQ